jgi:FkbM family methyltransferase
LKSKSGIVPSDSEFYINLITKLFSSFDNYYCDNYDYLRFGKISKIQTIKEFIKSLFLKHFFVRKFKFRSYSQYVFELLDKNNQGLYWLYEHLDDKDSKQLLIELIAYKILGHNYVKLVTNCKSYWDTIKLVKKLGDNQHQIKLKFQEWELNLFNLNRFGYDVNIYNNILGVNSIFLLEQYAYKSNERVIDVKPGDIVIDAGGCWGDGSLYFATRVGNHGKVYSFEFIPKNIEIFEKNISLNHGLSDKITLIQQPLWSDSGKKVQYIDNGPGSIVTFDALENADGETETISIDKFVEQNHIDKINFIKMDIEGAELFALKGAINTISSFKPTLAISIYHSVNDFTEIPRWIFELKLDYKLFLGHYSIHSEETILFATQ